MEINDAPTPAHPQVDPLEIAMLQSEFAAIGVQDASTAVSNWLGKPNRFTAQVMHSAMEVLTYFRAEIDARNRSAEAPQHEESKTSGHADALAPAPRNEPAERVVKPKANAEAKAQAELAGAAWRLAVKQRAEAMQQWDQYVRSMSDAYKAARAAAGLR